MSKKNKKIAAETHNTLFAAVKYDDESPKVLAVFPTLKAACTFIAAKLRDRLRKDNAAKRHMNPQRRLELEIAARNAAKHTANEFKFGEETFCVWDFDKPKKDSKVGLEEALWEINRMAEQRREVHERMMPKYYNPDFAQLHYGAEMKAMEEMRRRIVVLIQVCTML